jgi:2-polyprenyl-3-methyl-5-hydroxy-6-metoxy-1,4-benzoquinol methylase
MDEASYHRAVNIFSPADVYEKIRRLVDFEQGPKLKILDVGSGSGNLDSHLRDIGHSVKELDIASREHVSQDFIACDINKIWPVSDKDFDLVICTDVPEHLYDPKHILDESSRVLKMGGKLIFGVPNHFDFRQRLRMLFGKGIVHWDQVARFKETAWDYSHIRFFTLSELTGYFKQSGWNIVKMQLNFMGGGIFPSRLMPKFLKKILLKCWPNVFSGKFVFLLSRSAQAEVIDIILIPYTPLGL